MQKSIPCGTLILLALNFMLFFAGVEHSASSHDGVFSAMLSMFSHASYGHLASNMLLLFFLAPKIERTLGLYFIPFYLLCGFGAHYGFGLLNPEDHVLGASGAVSGLFVAYVFCCRYWMQMAISGIICGSYFVNEFLAMLSQQGGITFDFVAHSAHLGGAITGFVLLLIYFSKLR